MMINWKGALAAAALMTVATASLPVQAADTACGTDRKIDIAEMTWASAAALAHIHAHILEDGFGCNVEIVAGDTVPTSASMLSKGDAGDRAGAVDELDPGPVAEGHGRWRRSPNSATPSTAAVSRAGSSRNTRTRSHPELKTAEDILAHPELFADPGRSEQGPALFLPAGLGLRDRQLGDVRSL